MITTEVIQGSLAHGIAANTKAVKDGLGDGVRRAAVMLANDVAAHTPVRSGRARGAVQVLAHRYVEGGQVVKYDLSNTEAFYMRWVLRGAKAHRIYPKYQSERGLRQATRRAEKSGKTGSELQPRDALSFMFEGVRGFFSEVNHPGVRGRDILGERLAANKSRMLQEIYSSMNRSISRRR